jgi:hypothetical protein
MHLIICFLPACLPARSYFDPEAARAGIPEDCAALVEHLTADSAVLRCVAVYWLGCLAGE